MSEAGTLSRIAIEIMRGSITTHEPREWKVSEQPNVLKSSKEVNKYHRISHVARYVTASWRCSTSLICVSTDGPFSHATLKETTTPTGGWSFHQAEGEAGQSMHLTIKYRSRSG